MGKRINIKYGTVIGEWLVLDYIGDGKYNCRCSCGTMRSVKGKSLKSGASTSCGHGKNIKIDLTNRQFGEWTVLKESDIKGKWICKCSCGTIKNVDGHELRRGATNSCGHNRSIGNLEGKQFGEWSVLHKADKKRYWTCRCSCGKISDILDYSLIHQLSKSCGHDITKYSMYKQGDKFGELTLIRQIDKQLFEFKCSCGNIRVYNINSVVKNKNSTRSCGCKSNDIRVNTLIKYKGDFKTKGIPREKWQIDVLNNKESFRKYLSSLDRFTSRDEVAKQLGVTRTALYEAAKRFEIDITSYIDARNRGNSPEETEVTDYINNIYSGIIIKNSRTVIPPQELDIYLPEKKLAIEFNGTYWHSELYKDSKYHQEKTIACARKGIRLIHIFEYEWNDKEKQRKIKQLIKREILGSSTIIYGRKTNIAIINNNDAELFCNKYHLQNYTNSKISLGCFYKDELIGVMTFGKPRFNKGYQYEIVRLCWKDDISVIGGTEKLFEFFIKTFKPKNIITYSDISKFTGNVYLKLGFRDAIITNPNYIWINITTGNIFTRYQAQKRKLIELGIADNSDTEITAMTRLGYYRIYDSGNIKLSWNNKELE